MFEVRISPPRLAALLLSVFALLLVLHLAVVLLRIEYARDYVYGLAPRFDFDRPISVPDWYTGALFLLSAILSFLAAVAAGNTERKLKPYWTVLAVVLLWLSFDDVASLHVEVAALLSPEGVPVFAGWVWIYAAAAALLGLWLVPFLRALPASTAWALTASGLLFLSGAIGLTLAGGLLAEQISATPLAAITREQWVEVRNHWSYAALATLEESCEMAALVLYSCAVLGFLSRRAVSVRISFGA